VLEDDGFIVHNAYKDKNRVYKEHSPTISTPSGGGHIPEVMEVKTAPLKSKGRNQKNHQGKYALTVDVAQTNGVAIYQRPHGNNKGGLKEMPCLRASSFEHNDKLAYCIDANYWKGTNPEHFRKHHKRQMVGTRMLTPTECERLQGFPDGWTEGGQITIQYNIIGNIWQQLNAASVSDRQSTENQHSVLDIIKDGASGGMQISLTRQNEQIKESVKFYIASEMLTQENCVCDITSLGKDMVMLYKQSETSPIDLITKPSLISEKLKEKSIYPLWKLSLEGNFKKVKLSTISTLIKEIIDQKIFTCAKTGKPITTAIIHSSKSEQNFSGKELSDSQTASIPLTLAYHAIVKSSKTQRYKQMGNAVTVNVIEWIGGLLNDSL